MATSSAVPTTATKSRLLSSVIEYPDGDGTSVALGAEFEWTGMFEKIIAYGTPLSDTMKQEIAMAPEILLPVILPLRQQRTCIDRHVITELMKVYNARGKICVVVIPKNLPHDVVVTLLESLDETMPQLMVEKEENSRRLRRLKVYFMKED